MGRWIGIAKISDHGKAESNSYDAHREQQETRVAARSSRGNKVGKWVAMLMVATSSLNALQMPASVTVVCNDNVGLRAMKRVA